MPVGQRLSEMHGRIDIPTNGCQTVRMPRATYVYVFDVQPDRRTELAEWARTSGVPFWLSRPGLLSYRTYRVQAGSGTSMALAEFESGEALGRVLDSPEWAKILGEFQSCVSRMRSWVLGPGPTGDDVLRPAPPPTSATA